MKILVVGGTGLIGSKVVDKLRANGHTVISASPSTGIDTITGQGLAEAVMNTDIVIDLANSPSFADKEALEFFETSGRNLLACEINANVKHHIALSVVGTDRLQASGYFRAKQVQENLIKKSGVPFTIVHSTQFMEFLGSIVAFTKQGEGITASPYKIQPIASEDVASFVADFALGNPVNGIVEIGGPERFKLSELLQTYLIKTSDPQRVIEDPKALYFGVAIEEMTLVPEENAKRGSITFEDWFAARS